MGPGLPQWTEHGTLDLRLVSWSPTLGVESTEKEKLKKKTKHYGLEDVQLKGKFPVSTQRYPLQTCTWVELHRFSMHNQP